MYIEEIKRVPLQLQFTKKRFNENEKCFLSKKMAELLIRQDETKVNETKVNETKVNSQWATTSST
jgi:hypothetical protein